MKFYKYHSNRCRFVMKEFLLIAVVLFSILDGCSNAESPVGGVSMSSGNNNLEKAGIYEKPSKEGLMKRLTPLQFKVTQKMVQSLPFRMSIGTIRKRVYM